MAKLILGPKTFAAVMRSVYGSGSLKINRVIERTLRKGSNLVVALDRRSTDSLVTAIHVAETVNGRPSPFSLKGIEAEAVGMPALQFTLQEWGSVMRALNEAEAELDPNAFYGRSNVHLDITTWRKLVDPILGVILSQGSRGKHA